MIGIGPKKINTKEYLKHKRILSLPLARPAKGCSYIKLKRQPLPNPSKEHHALEKKHEHYRLSAQWGLLNTDG